jgi:hypothetical protein
MTKLKEQILQLRSQGLSYTEITNELNCSKGTVSYHCGVGQKAKSNARLQQFRGKSHPYLSKLERFTRKEKIETSTRKETLEWYRLIYFKIRCFHQNRITNVQTPPKFTVEDIIEKFGETPKCYLTGQSIDIYQPRTYQFDHITPVAKGGSNSLDNLGLCTSQANQCKRDLTHNQFVELCKQVVANHKS